MSVIVQDLNTNEITLLSKGADSVIKERLDLSDEQNSAFLERTQLYVDGYAEQGLRTLFLAKRSLTLPEYTEWNRRYQEALTLV